MSNHNKERAWTTLENMGTSTAAIQLVTNINGYTMETLEDILFCDHGYRSFDQLEDED